MNHAKDIAERYRIELPSEVMERAVSLACSISRASIVEQGRGDPLNYPRSNHPPEDHIYWETREKIANVIRGSDIKITHVLQIHEYSCMYMTKQEVMDYAEATWHGVKSNRVIVQEIMET